MNTPSSSSFFYFQSPALAIRVGLWITASWILLPNSNALAIREEPLPFNTVTTDSSTVVPAEPNTSTHDALRLQIVGDLRCDMGEQNSGEPCEVKIKDSKTGKVFFLSRAKTAMRLYMSGTRHVTLDGRDAGSETIEVLAIHPL